jgi:hypothetical protein
VVVFKSHQILRKEMARSLVSSVICGVGIRPLWKFFQIYMVLLTLKMLM